MGVELTWLGHGSWKIQVDEHSLLLDPFLDESPTAPCKAADIEAEYILISHGHFDHVADAAEIARRCDATLVACFEITEWFREKHSLERLEPMNLGGSISLPFGRVTMTLAWHSSQLPDGSYGGNPGGFVLEAAERRIYFACDTALFSDMKLIGQGNLDLAVLPIGDRFTMGPDEAVEAVKLLQPQRVVPAHYNTWPPIEQDAEKWAEQVREQTKAWPVVLAPGESFTL